MTEELEYLLDIGSRATSHKKAMDFTKAYLIKKKIKDIQKIENCLVISQVYAALKYKPFVKMEDIVIFLGSTEELPYEESVQDLTLGEDLKGLNLKEILDIVIQKEGTMLR